MHPDVLVAECAALANMIIRGFRAPFLWIANVQREFARRTRRNIANSASSTDSARFSGLPPGSPPMPMAGPVRLAVVGTAGPQEVRVDLDRLLDFRQRVSLRDVLRAVPVEGLDGELEDALHGGVVVRRCHLREEVWVTGGAQHDRVRPDLESLALGVVHQEQHGLPGGIKVARADELAVTAKVGERQYVVL